jgi:tRNA dimethylallyltransferase
MNAPNCLVLLGPTAIGKTKRGVELAVALKGEIISVDSRQVYRGLDIGTGKDLADYTLRDGTQVPYHLIDIIDLEREYNVFAFLRDSYAAFQDIASRGKLPILVGGTGLYLDAFIRGYDFGDDAFTDGNPRHHTPSGPREGLDRPDVRPKVLGMRLPRPLLQERIKTRLRERLDAGMVAEVAGLHAAGASWERLERLGLEYRFCAQFLQGTAPDPGETALFDGLFHAICQFARRQETWFRGMERRGLPIEWLE